MATRFDLEQQILNAWHVTDDIELLAQAVKAMDLPADHKNTVIARLEAINVLYSARFEQTFATFEELVHEQTI